MCVERATLLGRRKPEVVAQGGHIERQINDINCKLFLGSFVMPLRDRQSGCYVKAMVLKRSFLAASFSDSSESESSDKELWQRLAGIGLSSQDSSGPNYILSVRRR